MKETVYVNFFQMLVISKMEENMVKIFQRKNILTSKPEY